MTSSLGDEFKLPKLTDENYHAWSIRAKAGLQQKRCWKAVDPGFGTTMTDTESELNEKAISFLFLIVSDFHLEDVGDLTRAKDVWKALEVTHTSFGLLHKIMFLRELLNVVKTDDTSVQDYVSSIQGLGRKVSKAGINLEDNVIAIIILMGLPQEQYEGFVRSLEREEDNLSVKVVKTKLLLEEKRMKRDAERDSAVALVSRNNYQRDERKTFAEDRKGPEITSREPFLCFNCGGRNHISRYCKKERKKPEFPKAGKSDRERYENTKKKEATAYKASKKTAAAACVHDVNETTREERMSGKHRVLMTGNTSDGRDQHRWILDSGCTNPMTPYKDIMDNIVHASGNVESANKYGDPLQIQGKGSATLKMTELCGGYDIKLSEVYYVPSLSDNLISVSYLEKHGLKVVFENGEANAIDIKTDEVLLTAKREGNMYIVCTEPDDKKVSAVNRPRPRDRDNEVQKACRASVRTWHKRLGHCSEESVVKIPGIVIDRNKSTEGLKCDVCLQGKATRKPFPKKSETKTNDVLELIHSDVGGPFKPTSKGGARYYVTFLDDYSNYLHVALIKNKNEVFHEFCKFQTSVELFHGKSIKALQTDNGGEYCSNEFETHLEKCGIKHRKTVPYTPQQAGKAERINLTLLNVVRCMIIESGLSKTFWAEAMNTACFIRNLCPSSAIDGKVPTEVWCGQNVAINELCRLRVFGCQAWATVTEPARKKLDPRAVECILIGYEGNVKGFRLWDMKNQKLIVSRDVNFCENIFPSRTKTLLEPICQNGVDDKKVRIEQEIDMNPIDSDESDTEIVPEQPVVNVLEQPVVNVLEQPVVNVPAQAVETLVHRRSERLKKPKQCECCNLVRDSTEPRTVREALSGECADNWKAAMEEEIGQLSASEAWEIVRRPYGRKVIGSKWVFKVKSNEDGHIERYKARLVAQGYNQVQGIDYEDSYSPVVKIKSFRLLMALAVEKGWTDRQLDVKSAYLNSELKEELFMEQPECFEVNEKVQFVCKLNKSIYGLPQSGRCWNEYLDATLKKLSMKRSVCEPCVYYNDYQDLIIAVYVDDIAVWGIQEKVDWIVAMLMVEFDIRDLGRISYFLSFKVTRKDNSYVNIDQHNYVNGVLSDYRMSDAAGASTPLPIQGKRTKEPGEDEKFNEHVYRSAIGSIQYLANGTRPDLSYSTSKQSQFQTQPTVKDWNDLRQIFRYIRKTAGLHINYHKTGKRLMFFTDADWGSDKTNSKSFSGYVGILAGGVVTWRTKKQQSVALSSSEAEIIAMIEGSKEVIWIKHFFQELGLCEYAPDQIYADSQSAMYMIKSEDVSDRAKHIRIPCHFLRDEVNKEHLTFTYVKSDQNLADIMTKILSGPRIKVILNELGFSEL